MALSTISSLSESFTSTAPLSAEEPAPFIDKEKQGPDESDAGDATNDASGSSSTLPTAMNVDADTRKRHTDSNQEADGDLAPTGSELERSEPSAGQQTADAEKTEFGMEVHEKAAEFATAASSTPSQEIQNASFHDQSPSEDTQSELRGRADPDNNSEAASSDDEAILEVHD